MYYSTYCLCQRGKGGEHGPRARVAKSPERGGNRRAAGSNRKQAGGTVPIYGRPVERTNEAHRGGREPAENACASGVYKA